MRTLIYEASHRSEAQILGQILDLRLHVFRVKVPG